MAENGLGSSTGWGAEKEVVRAEPEELNGQLRKNRTRGLIYSVNVVPRDTSTLITEELPGQEDE